MPSTQNLLETVYIIYIATLNQAARNRNSLLSSFGGDPYGMGSTMLSKQQIIFGRRRRSIGKKEATH